MTDTLTLVTWNVWFGQWRRRARWHALRDTALATRPDVIALQEVTPPLRDALAAEIGAWPDGPWSLVTCGGFTAGYDVVLLARRRLTGAHRVALPSRMGRSLLVATLDCGLTIATVHLESRPESAPQRLAQLELVTRTLASLSDVILAGDLNFTPDSAEHRLATIHHIDTWPTLHADEPGFTIDTEVNEMRLVDQGEPCQKRLDRVLVRSTRWKPTHIDLLGKQPLPDDPLTFPSDHFGLVAHFAQSRRPQGATP